MLAVVKGVKFGVCPGWFEHTDGTETSDYGNYKDSGLR